MRYFDRENYRIVQIETKTTPEFWDALWSYTATPFDGDNLQMENFVTRYTKKYLSPDDGLILEGGCGRGKHVAELVSHGYRCIGIDYAPATVKETSHTYPQLDIRLGDVRRLGFETDTFAGYWSLGVIEHYWEGYRQIVSEMERVIRPNGYLFLTFPSISLLRKVKIIMGKYPLIGSGNEPDGFYQFILDKRKVMLDIQRFGFQLVYSSRLDGIKGVKSELHLFSKVLQSLYDYRGKSIPVKAIRSLLSILLSVFAEHATLLIFVRKNGSKNQT